MSGPSVCVLPRARFYPHIGKLSHRCPRHSAFRRSSPHRPVGHLARRRLRRARRPGPEGPGGVLPRRGAASGHTNAEIASVLHVARRTVETHLTATYRKLGIRRRVELSAVLNGR
ncbi:hypothetical protein GCM10022227_03740 [Streptomyces sedi]